MSYDEDYRVESNKISIIHTTVLTDIIVGCTHRQQVLAKTIVSNVIVQRLELYLSCESTYALNF